MTLSSDSTSLIPNSIAQAPTVTVLMAAYNAATYLRECIDSILNQTFTDFEFLIYNDGSSDDTAAIINSYTDPRISLINNTTNRGVSANMNDGIERTRGRYIVRMDADDVAYPERISKQVAYLEANPDVGLCGTAVRYIGATEALVYPPQDNEFIQQTLWLQNAFFQPSVIIRTNVLREHQLRYDTRYDPAEDYKLWSEMSAVTKVHNLSEVLLDYRIHPHQISRRQSIVQQKSSAQIRKDQMNRLHIHLRPNQEKAFQLLTIDEGWGNFQAADYAAVATLLEDLCSQAQRSTLNSEVIYRVAAGQWARILGAAKQYRPALLPFVVRQPWRKYIPSIIVVKLIAKCLLLKQVKR